MLISFVKLDHALYSIHYNTYRSVSGKQNLRFWPTWALARDQNSILLYRSYYSCPLKFGTWALAWGTGVRMCTDTRFHYSYS